VPREHNRAARESGRAAFAAAALLGMGSLSVNVTHSTVIATGPARQTISQTTPPPEPQTPFARPTMTAPPFGGWCSFCSSNAPTPKA
jgi:hypothetical protein